MRTSLLNNYKLLVSSFVLSTLVVPVCGRKRIIGGSDVTDKDRYPYFAQPAGSMVCGATLISDDVLISVAHCKGGFIARGIMLGGNRRDGTGSIRYDVEKEIIHEQYNNVTLTNDIMLIKLKGTVPQTVPRVVLNFDTNIPFDGQQLKVIGYGVTSVSNSDVPNYLQSVNFNAISSQQCFNHWGMSQVGKNKTLCTGSIAGGADACLGDSGGPIFISNTIPEVQVGIVSFGDGCGGAGIPSVNTRISGYKDWIQRNVCSVSSIPPAYCNQLLASAPIGAGPVSFRTPTKLPTRLPTRTPIRAPTKAPLSRPTRKPTNTPTRAPQLRLSQKPIQSPTREPITRKPIDLPTKEPRSRPTRIPTEVPRNVPKSRPTQVPRSRPTQVPRSRPTLIPTEVPTKVPRSQPTRIPTEALKKEPQSRTTRTPVQSSIDLPTIRQFRTPTATVIPVQSPVQVLVPTTKVYVLSPIITTAKNQSPPTRAPVRLRKPIRKCVPLNKNCNDTTKLCCGTAKCVVVPATNNKQMIINLIKSSAPNKRICKNV